MDSQEDKIELSKTKNDYVASTLKSSLGAIPFAGPLLAEIAGEVIPNQREDRIIEFAEILEGRLSDLEENFVKSQIQDEYFTDLIEEGIRQASRAISKERKEYIASIITNSLSSDEIDFIESKHLMKILGELNDIELILLKSFSLRTSEAYQEFRKKHENILSKKPTDYQSTQRERDEEALHESYKEHLSQFGLLKPKFKQEIKGRRKKMPQFNNSTGEKIKSGYQITELGKLLLKKLDLYNPKELK